MSLLRRDLVLKAFNNVDKTGTGEVSLKDLASSYSASCHPEVLSKRKSPEDVYNDFLECFELHHVLTVVFYI